MFSHRKPAAQRSCTELTDCISLHLGKACKCTSNLHYAISSSHYAILFHVGTECVSSHPVWMNQSWWVVGLWAVHFFPHTFSQTAFHIFKVKKMGCSPKYADAYGTKNKQTKTVQKASVCQSIVEPPCLLHRASCQHLAAVWTHWLN